MRELTRQQCGQIAGGDPGMSLAGGGGTGGGGGEGGGGGFGGSGGSGVGGYDIFAVSVEGGQMAVVQISGSIPVFDNTQPIAMYGAGEAPWEGGYLGAWVDAPPMSYEHTAFDGALMANTGRLVGAATAAFIEGAIAGAEVGLPAGPIGNLAGVVVGGFAALGTYYLLQHDHPTGHFVAIP